MGKGLEIFKLCDKLVELLNDNEAIADLELCRKRHPEMFENNEQVANLIRIVLNEPDIIIKNTKPRSEKDYIATKKLNDEKMGDVGIRDDRGTNVIYHANLKKIEELQRLQEKIRKGSVQVVGSPTSYTQAQSLDGLVKNDISPATNKIIPQDSKKTKDSAKVEPQKTQKQNKSKDKDNDMSM